jgi:hypothetical protein
MRGRGRLKYFIPDEIKCMSWKEIYIILVIKYKK